MSEAKDSAIKLFGKTIPLTNTPVSAAVSVSGGVSIPSPDPAVYEELPSSPEENQSNQKTDEVLSGERLKDARHENGTQPVTSEEIADSNATAANENTKTPHLENKAATTKSLKTEEQSDTSNSQEKTLTKPDKILPCPRCNSMDTKFCYYNNYNVNQPRHFCKNCQRYWTAGGTMRSVPVGAGRRKNKNLASHYRHITMSETLQNARADLPNGSQHPTLKPNGTVLTFGTNSPLCESMAQVLNIAESTIRNCARNGFHKPEEQMIPISYGGGENGDDQSSGSSATVANSKDDGKHGPHDSVMQNFHSFPPLVPCFPGAAWPYLWTSAQWSPPFCLPGYSLPFYSLPPSYWGCTMPETCNAPCVTAPSSGPNFSTLGKHSREETTVKQTSSGEEELQKENNPEPYLWIPKTLRIDDLGEAAKSSIWATLGIKSDKADSISGRGLFKAFQSNGGEKNHISDTSSVLQANPAALSRSSNFHESL